MSRPIDLCELCKIEPVIPGDICNPCFIRLKAERSDAPEGLPEGSNPSNTNDTQEGAQEPKEGGAA